MKSIAYAFVVTFCCATFFSVAIAGQGESKPTPGENSAQLKQKWSTLLNDYSFNKQDQSFCYGDTDQGIYGSQIDHKVRLASVSKLVTSYWAVSQLGSGHRFPTNFYYHDGQLHLQGGDDPLLAKRKIFFLVSQLNNWGITKIKRITFDQRVKVFAAAEGYLGTVLNVTRTRTKTNLKDFFDRSNWNKLKGAYRSFIASLPATLIDELHMIRDLDQLELKVGKVEFSAQNPLADHPKTEHYQHLSSLLSRYLKFMNIVSNNFVADQVFKQLGGETQFDQFIATFMEQNFPRYGEERSGFDKKTPSIKLFTGSGLNTRKNGSRVDNYATCRVILKIIESLNGVLTIEGKSIQQLVAVPGVDKGTFRRRLRSPRLARLMVAKTGTLYHTSALAGMLSTSEGNRYFGIFHQKDWGAASAKIIQNKMVVNIFDQLGAGARLDYTPQFFFPADAPLLPVK
jgi:serine-type D-Ala-D-Ala carboxypeptidase/endopeptidase (penicillin-binding protein 4)